MKHKLENVFKKHLNTICQSETLKKFALEFYYDFCEKFEGKTFSKNNFETLTINGKTVEQDIVKDIFKHKNIISYEDVFVYLFVKNVENINFYENRNNASVNQVGCFSPAEKFVGIKRFDVMKFYNPPSKLSCDINRPNNLSDVEWNNLYNTKMQEIEEKNLRANEKAILDAEQNMNLFYKHNLYHELCHVFELKSFENGKYIKFDKSDSVFIKNNNEYIFCKSGYNVDFYEEVLAIEKHNKRMQNIYAENILDLIAYYKYHGASCLSEIYNEVLASQIGNFFEVKEKKSINSMGLYYKKARLLGNCAYNLNYDLVEYFNIAMPNINNLLTRFNTKQLIEEINSLNISAPKLNYLKNKFIDILISSTNSAKQIRDYEILRKYIEPLDNYSSISLILGGYSRLVASSNKVGDECKMLIQTIFLEAIKNNIAQQLNDENVIKDKEFFLNLNNLLTHIDQFALYPNSLLKTYSLSKTSKHVQTNYVYEIDMLSINQYCVKYKHCHNLSVLNEIFIMAKNAVKTYGKDIENIDDIMTVLLEQEILEENYIQVANETQAIIKNQAKKLNPEKTKTNKTAGIER